MSLAVLITTFLLFTFEAFLHYNIGKGDGLSLTNLSLPSFRETFEITGVVFIFSLINSYFAECIEKIYK